MMTDNSAKIKKYRVWFHVTGEQGVEVEARSTKEAKQKAIYGQGEPIDFFVLKSHPSTCVVVKIE